MPKEYTDPVAKLLTYGVFSLRRRNEPWPDYLELGFAAEHVPELIRMTKDDTLNNAAQDSLEVWAPLHAWRSLGQLQAVEAAEPLVRLLEEFPDDDHWLPTELPEVFSLIGPAAIPEIAEFLADIKVDEMCRTSVPECLERMALTHIEHRDECVGVLERQLASFEANGPALNAFLILSLSKLQATEAIDTIRAAFSAGCVDLLVQGDVEDVEIDMGLRLSRDTPPPKLQLSRDLLVLDEDHFWDDDLDDLQTNTFTNPFRHVGRNDPCPCGSGKKYKRCCLQ